MWNNWKNAEQNLKMWALVCIIFSKNFQPLSKSSHLSNKVMWTNSNWYKLLKKVTPLA